mgnify:CR=1 FL=1
MANFALYPSFLAHKDTFEISSDFHNFATGQDGWTSLVADAGTSVAVNDARGGILTLTTGATDNNEVMIRSTTELFLPTAGRPCFARGRINIVQANTDDINFFFGFASAAAADLLVDNGGDPRTSGSIFGITCSENDTVWHGYSRNGTTSTDTASAVSNNDAAGVYREYEVRLEEFSASQCVVTYYIDGMVLRDDTIYANPIAHRVSYTSLTEMNFAIYAKAGGATSETPLIDWAIAAQVR